MSSIDGPIRELINALDDLPDGRPDGADTTVRELMHFEVFRGSFSASPAMNSIRRFGISRTEN